MHDLDIVMPVYNEGANVGPVLESLKRHVKASWRLLLCYDHDDDDTLPVARALDVPVTLVKNPGRSVHSAVLAGFAASEAQAVLMFPADDDRNAERIDAMLEQARAGAALVCADRFMPGGRMEGCPPLKHAMVRTAAFLLRNLAGLPVDDPTNGLRLISREVLRTVPIESTKGFSWSLELLVKCHRLGLKVGRVPSVWIERSKGQSRFRIAAWVRGYLRWFFYAFQTSWLGFGPATVPRRAP